MDDLLSRNWWAIAVRGLLALGFGVVAFARPGFTLTLLVIIFGAYMLDDGVFAIVAAVRAARREERWWPMALEGVLGVVVGLLTFLVPTAAASVIFLVIAAWAVVTGVLEIIAGARLRKQIAGEWLLALSGLLRIALGVLLFVRPGQGLHALVVLTGSYAFAYGVVMLALSFKLKRRHAGGARTDLRPQPA
jgi:uncharacterized membrane protein HdeD (DUF308 family)